MDIAKFLASARAKMKIPKPRNDDAKISTKTKTGPEPRNEASASIDDAKISTKTKTGPEPRNEASASIDDAKISTKMKAGPESGSQGSASIDDAKISNKMKTGPESGSQGSAIDEDKISAKTVHEFANSGNERPEERAEKNLSDESESQLFVSKLDKFRIALSELPSIRANSGPPTGKLRGETAPDIGDRKRPAIVDNDDGEGAARKSKRKKKEKLFLIDDSDEEEGADAEVARKSKQKKNKHPIKESDQEEGEDEEDDRNSFAGYASDDQSIGDGSGPSLGSVLASMDDFDEIQAYLMGTHASNEVDHRYMNRLIVRANKTKGEKQARDPWNPRQLGRCGSCNHYASVFGERVWSVTQICCDACNKWWAEGIVFNENWPLCKTGQWKCPPGRVEGCQGCRSLPFILDGTVMISEHKARVKADTAMALGRDSVSVHDAIGEQAKPEIRNVRKMFKEAIGQKGDHHIQVEPDLPPPPSSDTDDLVRLTGELTLNASKLNTAAADVGGSVVSLKAGVEEAVTKIQVAADEAVAKIQKASEAAVNGIKRETKAAVESIEIATSNFSKMFKVSTRWFFSPGLNRPRFFE